jgi:hypothetical protein
MVVVQHDFDRLLFAKSGVPFLKRLPLTFSIHAGAFWTSFAGASLAAGDTLLQAAKTPYTELGFGFGNLAPFLSPLNCAVRFTWQLSSYPTGRFNFLFKLARP